MLSMNRLFTYGRYARILVGLIFLLSGLTKGFDLIGTSQKVEEYAEVLSLNFPPLLYDLLSCCLVGVELFIGVSLILRLYHKTVLRLSLIITFIFLCLTLIIAIDGKMDDCGCFGGYFKFSAWQSFAKNVALLLVVIVASFEKTHHTRYNKASLTSTLILLLWIVSFCTINLSSQPITDSSHYKNNTHILSYEQSPFDIELPNKVENKIVYESITDSILKEETIVLGIVRESNTDDSACLNKFVEQVQSLGKGSGANALLLTSSLENIAGAHEFGLADNNTLKALSSSHIGIVILREGVVTGRWQQNHLRLQTFPETTGEIKHSSSARDNRMKLCLWLLSLLVTMIFIIVISNNRGSRKTEKE